MLPRENADADVRKVPTTTPPANAAKDVRKCAFFLKRKNRCCTAVAAPGLALCPLHERERRAAEGAAEKPSDAPPDDALVPCPHNGNHSVLKSRLQRHVHVCPDRLRDPRLLPFFALNCNFPGAAAVDEPLASRPARQQQHSSVGRNNAEAVDAAVDDDEHAGAADDDHGGAAATISAASARSSEDLESLAERMEARVAAATAGGRHFEWARLEDPAAAGASAPAPASTSPPFAVFPGLEAYVAAGRAKHRTQHAALLGVMSAADMLVGSNVRGFVELGAGKGGLAGALKHVLPNARVVAVDQELFRDMCDRELRQRGTPIERVCMNVKDFSLPKFSQAQPCEQQEGSPRPPLSTDARWVVCGKHLCGGCTDFALFAAVAGKDAAAAAADVCIATCCHHRCTWDALFADKDTSGLFRDADDFRDVVRMTSWATGGPTVPLPLRRAGRAAKVLIDAARIAKLSAIKAYASVRLVQYATSDFTEEYHAIVAKTAERNEAGLPPPR